MGYLIIVMQPLIPTIPGIYDNYIHRVDTSQAISLAPQINQGIREEHSGWYLILKTFLLLYANLEMSIISFLRNVRESFIAFCRVCLS